MISIVSYDNKFTPTFNTNIVTTDVKRKHALCVGAFTYPGGLL